MCLLRHILCTIGARFTYIKPRSIVIYDHLLILQYIWLWCRVSVFLANVWHKCWGSLGASTVQAEWGHCAPVLFASVSMYGIRLQCSGYVTLLQLTTMKQDGCVNTRYCAKSGHGAHLLNTKTKPYSLSRIRLSSEHSSWLSNAPTRS